MNLKDRISKLQKAIAQEAKLTSSIQSQRGRHAN